MKTEPPHVEALSALTPTRHWVEVEARRTAYWTYGSPCAPPLVLVHGFRGDHHGLEPLAAHLAGFAVIVPDLPGFGESEPFASGAHGLAEYAAWLQAFVTTVTPGPAVLLGHSFGSVVVAGSVGAGLRTPAMILVNPIGVPPLTGRHRQAARVAMWYYRIAAALPDRLGRSLLTSRTIVRATSGFLVTSSDPRLRVWIHAQHRRYFSNFARRDVVLDAFWASVRCSVSEHAATIDVPTLLICSDADQVTAAGDQYRLAEAIPDAELVMIAGVGHLIHYETPGRAAWEVSAFWERVRRQQRVIR